MYAVAAKNKEPVRTFKEYVRRREHAETVTDNDNDKSDREATRQKLVQIAKVACHKHPKIMIGLLDRIGQQDSEIKSALEDLKKNLKGSSLGTEQGLGDMNGRDEVVPNAADSMGGDSEGGDN
jgi:hypothetical protein